MFGSFREEMSSDTLKVVVAATFLFIAVNLASDCAERAWER